MSELVKLFRYKSDEHVDLRKHVALIEQSAAVVAALDGICADLVKLAEHWDARGKEIAESAASVDDLYAEGEGTGMQHCAEALRKLITAFERT